MLLLAALSMLGAATPADAALAPDPRATLLTFWLLAACNTSGVNKSSAGGHIPPVTTAVCKQNM